MTRTLLTAIALGMSTPVFAVLSVTTGLIHPTRRSWAFAARWWARSLLVPAGVRLEVSGREHVTDGGSFTLTGGVLDHEPIVDGASASNAFARAAAIELERGLRFQLGGVGLTTLPVASAVVECV